MAKQYRAKKAFTITCGPYRCRLAAEDVATYFDRGACYVFNARQTQGADIIVPWMKTTEVENNPIFFERVPR